MTVKTIRLATWAPSRGARTLRQHLGSWMNRYEARRHLLDLDERLLRDIGLTRVEAEHEAAKPFWVE